MPDNNLPASGTVETTPIPPTYDEQVEDLSNLLGDPADEPDLPEVSEDATAADEPEPFDPATADPAEDVEASDDSDDPDGPDEVKGGRFAPDSAKVLFDGETISIAELKGRVDKRVKDMQRDYTQKAQAIAAEKSEVEQYAQSLSPFRDYLAAYAEQHLPQDPGVWKGADDDYVGQLDHNRKKEAWLEHVRAYQVFQQHKQEEDQKRKGETQKQAEERAKGEFEALVKSYPFLTDRTKAKQFWDATYEGAAKHYGITEPEVRSVGDHRMILALRDAIAYRRIKAAAPKVQEEVTRKPVKATGRRTTSQTPDAKGKQARTERLRNSGSFNDGVAALTDFDL